ncbi:uncharacterized protein METZ01_LOCUS485877 [marine metagenome]|uniref:Uncharacterized protein n=1 Tax=marine metagenome TaxID=408172 RepID=A0A383CLU7_9ZZZZ
MAYLVKQLLKLGKTKALIKSLLSRLHLG